VGRVGSRLWCPKGALQSAETVDWGAVGRAVGPSGAQILHRDSIAAQLGFEWDSTGPRPSNSKKRGSGWLPRRARRFRYSSKRRRNRSSIRLVNEPPPLLRRWRPDPGAEPEASGLRDNRGPVMA
jgi:hypothetical protein